MTQEYMPLRKAFVCELEEINYYEVRHKHRYEASDWVIAQNPLDALDSVREKYPCKGKHWESVTIIPVVTQLSDRFLSKSLISLLKAEEEKDAKRSRK